MRFATPEIAWHNRDPVYSVDIQPVNQVDPATNDVWYRLATSGADAQIVLWQVFQRKHNDSFKQPKIEVLSQLTRHEKAVNVVRFIPTGEDTLASADVDGIIIIWKKGEADRFTTDFEQSEHKASVKPVSPPKQIKENNSDVIVKEDDEEEEDIPVIANFEEEIVKIENWNQWKVLRGHLEDVVDISWSSDGLYLLSASVDNESIVWDVNKGCKTHMLSGHKSWVQGVAWDPLNEYLTTISADRCLRVFSTSTKKNIFKVEKGSVMHEGSLTKTRLFYDYTLSSFTRRLSFSPGGEFLLVPSGVLEFPKLSDLTTSPPVRRSEKAVNNNCPVNTAPVEEEEAIDCSPSGSTKENDVSINNNVDCVEVERMEVDTEKDDLDKGDNNHLSDNKSNEEEPMNEDDVGDEGADGEDADDEDFDDDDEIEAKAVKLEKPPPEEPELNYINTCHLFLRNNISKPLAYLPTGEKFCHAVRFCPTRFQLIQCENSSRASQENSEIDEEETDVNPFPFPYRLIFAVATQNAVILYDSQHMTPFAYITDIHYTRISDIAWSRDGRLLMISSTDGFCTFVTFAEGEIGVEYEGEAYVFPVAPESPAKNEENIEFPSAEGSQSSKDSDKVKGTGVSNGSASAIPEVIIKTPSVGKFFTKVSREERLENMNKELSMLDTTPKRVLKKIPDAPSSTPEVVFLDHSELESKQLLDKTINDVAEGKLGDDGPETTPEENTTSNPSSQTSCVQNLIKTSPVRKNPFVLSVRRASKPTHNVEGGNIQTSQTRQQQESNGQEDENKSSESSDRMEVIDIDVSQVTDSVSDGDIPSASTSTVATEGNSEEVKKPRRVNFVTLIKANKPA